MMNNVSFCPTLLAHIENSPKRLSVVNFYQNFAFSFKNTWKGYVQYFLVINTCKSETITLKQKNWRIRILALTQVPVLWCHKNLAPTITIKFSSLFTQAREHDDFDSSSHAR